MAGKGSEIGRTFEELAAIYDGVMHNDKLRVCFDTCHTSDSGYDIIHHFDAVMDSFDRILGKKNRLLSSISTTARISPVQQKTGMKISDSDRLDLMP